MPGIRWIRVAIPFTLDHVNAWAIREADGWAIVDVGMCSEASKAAWRSVVERELDGLPVTRIFVTHSHTDHCGIASWLAGEYGCPLWMTRLEYLHGRMARIEALEPVSTAAIDFYRLASWNDEDIDAHHSWLAAIEASAAELPGSYRRIQDGELIRIGDHDWRVIIGAGHSPEHACFYCPDLKLLISGDQVLPCISSNVSVRPSEPDENPMEDWLASMDKLRREVGDDVLVLPAHNDCFYGLHSRLNKLAASQLEALDRIRVLLTSPRCVTDLFPALFGRSISHSQTGLFGLATGEALACLNFLMHRGEVRRNLCEDGIWRFKLDQ